ncbi:hypothetical protein ACJRO7_016735 [Eucalyptus globulus]|uniref:Uncharacterized protein n=1 Tax=Eucalyptus globulus TaxID=34317 RepID=A0ABD3L7Z2_EUCGL
MLVTLGFLVMVGYRVWLWHQVCTHPFSFTIGTNSRARRFWVSAIVRTPRNTTMGSTLMATTLILPSTGMATVVSSTYSVKKALNDAVHGTRGQFTVPLMYVTPLTLFFFSFLCHSLSIRNIHQVNILINSPQDNDGVGSPEYDAEPLEMGFLLNTVRNCTFNAGLPLLLWIFGLVSIFLFSLTLVRILSNLNFVFLKPNHSKPKPISITSTSSTNITITTTRFAWNYGFIMCIRRSVLAYYNMSPRLHFELFCPLLLCFTIQIPQAYVQPYIYTLFIRKKNHLTTLEFTTFGPKKQKRKIK